MSYELDTETVKIPIEEIKVGVSIKNIRTLFPEDRIKELAESIYNDGLLNPLVVMQAEGRDGGAICELVCGARRLRAIQWIRENLDENWGEGEVKCTQYTGSIEDAVLLNGLENIEREEVDDVDTCAWLFRMVEEGGRTQDDMAKRMHKSSQWVSMRITIHRKGSDLLKQAMRDGLVRISTAYELAKQLSTEDQDKRIKTAYKNAEKLIKLDEAEVSGNPDKVPKPSKKKLGDILAQATKASSDPNKRNAHGVAMGIRLVLGLASEDEVVTAIHWEGDAPVPASAEMSDDEDDTDTDSEA